MARRGFAFDVEDFTLRFLDGAEDTVRATAIQLWDAIIGTTPVDEGRARGNWFPTTGTPSVKIDLDIIDKSGAKAKQRAERHVLGSLKWDVFTLTNNLPYILTLENGGYPDPVKLGTNIGKDAEGKPIYEKRSKSGYSKQAPNGMVRLNIKRFDRLLTINARKHLPK